jgi:hypothetical protein
MSPRLSILKRKLSLKAKVKRLSRRFLKPRIVIPPQGSSRIGNLIHIPETHLGIRQTNERRFPKIRR